MVLDGNFVKPQKVLLSPEIKILNLTSWTINLVAWQINLVNNLKYCTLIFQFIYNQSMIRWTKCTFYLLNYDNGSKDCDDQLGNKLWAVLKNSEQEVNFNGPVIGHRQHPFRDETWQPEKLQAVVKYGALLSAYLDCHALLNYVTASYANQSASNE